MRFRFRCFTCGDMPVGISISPIPAPDKPASARTTRRRAPAGRNYFYLCVGLAVALIVTFGFSRTLGAGLLHPPSPRPLILYLHAAMFTIWVLLFIAQAALAQVRRVSWHRRLGLAGFALGCVMPMVGIETALAMTRLHIFEGNRNEESALIVPFFDMLAFAVLFGLAACWRRRPEYHRRLMLLATCGLTVAAFARFPRWLMPYPAWYVAVDALMLTGPVHDWVTLRRVHPVYLYGVPALALGQAATMWIYLGASPGWTRIARALLQM